MSTATVQSAGPDTIYGSCFASIPGLPAGSRVRIASRNAAIFCRLAWDLTNRLTHTERVLLDRWQVAALGVADGEPVDVARLDAEQVPPADAVEVRLDSWTGPDLDAGAGLAEFLRNGHYLLYPGLRFLYQPLGAEGRGEYVVVSVRAGGVPVEVASMSDRLEITVRRAPGAPGRALRYEDIGGLDHAIALLRREVELPLRRRTDLAAIGVTAPSGVLIYGPPGTGKTLLARTVAAASGARTTMLSGSALAAKQPPEAEAELRAAFAAEAGSSHLVILDDLDYIAGDRSAPGAVSPLLSVLQQVLDEPDRPVVIATTTRRDHIDPAIRRLGRIGHQVAVTAPSEDDRRAILTVHNRNLALSFGEPRRTELTADLARRTAGFVGADLEALCDEAGRVALRRAFPAEELESATPTARAPLQIQPDDWEEALTLVSPSAIGSVVSEIPATTFADIAGLDRTATELSERLVLPLSRPQVFAEAGLRMERGVLLYGPPGTGKTLLARAVAHECGARFIAVRGPELLTKWFGESEQAVRDLFERARSVAPCVIFFDEIEAVARRRNGGATDGGAGDRVVNQLLAEMDGLVDLGPVSIIGATNNADAIDPAILRPGRLGLHIEVPLPDHAGRVELFAMYLRADELAGQYPAYASMTEGSSAAEVAMIAREARLGALRRVDFAHAEPITDEDVLAGIRRRR
ncbi:AAA family ATPase [Actinoplanes sp. KI2]|uniref:AAA family ATPase n=1 Tax=Actinoplanes sp. KI2 TaxID=2983315 RepID=UPI0021D57D6E|nr:AAA family ATPase [Actinoplanes sp. KI2]MCU7728844.1 AAA family ATPase [Actinoplanes sp. KI2]